MRYIRSYGLIQKVIGPVDLGVERRVQIYHSTPPAPKAIQKTERFKIGSLLPLRIRGICSWKNPFFAPHRSIWNKGLKHSYSNSSTLPRFQEYLHPSTHQSDHSDGDGETVYKALKSDGGLTAVKEVKITNDKKDKRLINDLRNEITILRKDSHPNIIHYQSVTIKAQCQDTNYLGLELTSDFVRHDTLETRYKEFDLTINERLIAIYSRHTLEGIQYLHKKNIVHRDIRCANIRVDDTGVCKLVNFGKARELTNKNKEAFLSSSFVGKPDWMAPELATPGESYQWPVDIWSLGCTVLEMFIREKPFGKNLSDIEVLEKLKNGIGPDIPTNISLEAQGFIKRCLHRDPRDRPTASELLRDQFVVPQDKPKIYPEPEMIQRTWDDPLMHMSSLISEILGSIHPGEPAVILVRTDWLENCQSDDDQVHNLLFCAGYVPTFEIDTFSCFEKVLDFQERECHSMSAALAEEYPISGMESTLDMTGSDQSTSDKGEVENQDNVVPYITQGDRAGEGGKEDVSVSREGRDAEILGATHCSAGCPNIPLITSIEHSSYTDDSGKAVLGISEGESEKIEVELAAECCVSDSDICIKFTCLKGEIYGYSEGSVLREIRLSVSAKVGDEILILTSKNPGKDQSVVCSSGRAHWEYSQGKERRPWYWIFKPYFNFFGMGGSIGEVGMWSKEKAPILVCQKGSLLELVTLELGQRGCRDLNFRKVFVLKRSMHNTVLAHQNTEVTCVDASEALSPTPVTLTGRLNHGRSSIEITCCVEIVIDFIDYPIGKIVKDNMCMKTSRRKRTITLCESPGPGHVKFMGSYITLR
ncbi:hypothetical protein R1flu_004691 [Riccia fluitans]|uniref:Protein kinase domain-containing protein n=1 Tax=Riccia fluitans TaxID=41844 RepID=A0ABD1YR12_9MARC